MKRRMKHRRLGVWLLALTVLSAGLAGCYSRPDKLGNLCTVFGQRPDWYSAARRSRTHWHIPIAEQMAILFQESMFRPEARPPCKMLLSFIPWLRPSSTYGYAQANNATWARYRRAIGDPWAAHDDFASAVYFVGWYAHRSVVRSGIAPGDAYRQYLAYHEGHHGFSHATYRRKPRLLRTARHIARLAHRYSRQLSGCRHELDSHRWWWPF